MGVGTAINGAADRPNVRDTCGAIGEHGRKSALYLLTGRDPPGPAKEKGDATSVTKLRSIGSRLSRVRGAGLGGIGGGEGGRAGAGDI